MPWETKFNIDNAISQAANVFWAKGYKSTSLNDLLSAMQINKGSFYNTFGSKKELFTRSLKQYEQKSRDDFFGHLMSIDDPLDSINTLFDSLIESSCSDPEKKGCFFVNTAIDLPNHDPDIAETVKKCFDDMTAFLEERLEKGISMKLVNNAIDVPSMAKTLLSLGISIRVLSRGVMKKDELIPIKTQALMLIQPVSN